jgi:hypothetical protein
MVLPKRKNHKAPDLQISKRLLTVLAPLFFALTLLCQSCLTHSIEDYREDGEGIVRALIHELQQIHSRDELVSASTKIKRLFLDLVNVIIAAQEYREHHPSSEFPELSKENHLSSDQLRSELNRIYRLEGGRELIEKYQEPALHRLDAYEKKLSKKKR